MASHILRVIRMGVWGSEEGSGVREKGGVEPSSWAGSRSMD